MSSTTRASATFIWSDPDYNYNMTLTRLIGLAAAAIWLTSCLSNNYHIKGTANSFADGEVVYLTINPHTLSPHDSAVIKDGTFLFDGTTDSTCAAIIYAKHTPSQYVDMLLTPGSAEVMFSAPPGHSRISGSRIHDEWQAMNDQLNQYADNLRCLVKASDHLTNNGHAVLYAESQRIEQEMRACIVTTAKRNADNPLGRFITTHFADSLNH